METISLISHLVPALGGLHLSYTELPKLSLELMSAAVVHLWTFPFILPHPLSLSPFFSH